MYSVRSLDNSPREYNRIPDTPVRTGNNMSVRSRKTPVSQALPPSPAESTERHRSTPSPMGAEEDRIMNGIVRGAPGDQSIFSEGKTPEQKQVNRRKSQFYGETFAQREPITSARERVSRESPIIADLRTNVIIQDEYTFITDLSSSLSIRYQRPDSSIVVTAAHSACLLFKGSFEPAYTLTITALPSQLQPATNKRNAALLQRAMHESLGVQPDRGIIKFMPILEENLAINGKTIAGEIEETERGYATDDTQLRNSSIGANKSRKRPSMRSLRNIRGSNVLGMNEERTSPIQEENRIPRIPPTPIGPSPLDQKAAQRQRMGRRKSFMALFRPA